MWSLWLTFTLRLLFGRVDDFDYGRDLRVLCFEPFLSFETLADLDCLNKTIGCCVYDWVIIYDVLENDGLLV